MERRNDVMKKVAVVYSSKFGHTKQYADWLKGDLDDVDVINIAGFNPTQLLAYKLIIFACGVYGDKLSVMDFIKKNLSAINPQKIMIMAVSWYTNDSEEAAKKLIEENYPEQFKNVVPIYVVNSGIDKKKVSPMDTMKLLAAQVMIEKKDGRSSDDINALAILKGYADQTSKDNLESIKKGIEEYFNPVKKETPAPEPKETVSAPEVKPAPVPEIKPVSKPEQERTVKPMDVSEMKSDADALSSLENAFKALKAPKSA
ncbi:MAG: flavodoxin family protein, partial [Oscillospiraceae bacterium]